MPDYVMKIIDLVLGGLVEKWRARKALKREFDVIRRRVLYVGLRNNLSVELHALRVFLIENGLVENSGIRDFFDTWLTDPVVISGRAVVNVYPEHDIERLMEQLTALKI